MLLIGHASQDMQAYDSYFLVYGVFEPFPCSTLIDVSQSSFSLKFWWVAKNFIGIAMWCEGSSEISSYVHSGKMFLVAIDKLFDLRKFSG